jgi:hypothetical protein
MPPLTEQTKVLITAVGLAIMALGYLWLIVRAFQSKTMWGFAVLLLPPLGGVMFIVAQFKRALPALVVMVLGGVVAAAPYVFPDPPEKAIIEQKDEGLHITITGLETASAAELFPLHRDTVATVQAATQREVTDEILELLRGAPNLREIDLNDTPITDKGLEVLASMPKLEKVRIARTKATPEGVQKHVLSSKTIKEIDVGGLNVPAKPLRDWKNADPQHRKYVN